jgi:hypothetical protein
MIAYPFEADQFWQMFSSPEHEKDRFLYQLSDTFPRSDPRIAVLSKFNFTRVIPISTSTVRPCVMKMSFTVILDYVSVMTPSKIYFPAKNGLFYDEREKTTDEDSRLITDAIYKIFNRPPQ